MAFVADDLGAWLVATLADAGRKKLTTLVLGGEQDRTLRQAATTAVRLTAEELRPGEKEQAEHIALVISQVFSTSVPMPLPAGQVTLLEGLRAGIAGQLAVLDNAGLTGTGQSSADALEVPAAVLTEKLTGHLVREIVVRGSRGGPLVPLASQLNDDVTHLQGRRLEELIGQLAEDLRASAAGQQGDGQQGDGHRHARAIRLLPGSASRVQACEADLRRLGVHAAISVPGVPDEIPPEYVPRDVDPAEHGVRAKVAAAASQGGFVLLVGGSSVGKTRCAAETVKMLLPDWWLVHPASPAEVSALAAALPARTVVWLDELQRYLDGKEGLTGGMVRALLNAPDPVVIIGTLWPDLYTTYSAVPTPGGQDPHAREREVLDIAEIVRISGEFSAAEQNRALAAATRDRRLKAALEVADYGLTQTLAAAPHLVARWQDAKTSRPYAWAVLTAALDAARLGARAPLSADFLRVAAPGYCTSRQQAEAPEDWLEQALAYATGKLHGAAAALSPTGADMGLVAGYTAADYLVQHASHERRYDRLPASTWDAILDHIPDSHDAARLAESARSRLLYRYAFPLFCHAADAGNETAAMGLARLLGERGDLDELRARADGSDHSAAQLARLLAERGDLDELRARACVGNTQTASRLARLLVNRGDVDELARIQHFPFTRDNADDIAVTNVFAWQLADLLARRGDLDELRARADADDWAAAHWLPQLLIKRGDVHEAAQILRVQRGSGPPGTAYQLAAERRDLNELRALADAGDQDAAQLLAYLLSERGDVDGLRALADATRNETAAMHLAYELAKRGGALAELITRADTGNDTAAKLVACLLAKHAAKHGALDLLRARADAGDRDADYYLMNLLAERGDLDELRARADAGNETAAMRLAGLLGDRGDLDELRARADTGDWAAADQLAEQLAEREDLDLLRARVDAGDVFAAEPLINSLIRQGRSEEAERLRQFGLNPDGSIACG